MTDENQIVVPRSFIDLYLPPGRLKPTESRETILAHYELCEDLAQMLTETAQTRLFELGITQGDVLERIFKGLRSDQLVSEAQARWVMRRLAELLNWDPGELPDCPDP